MTWREKSNFKTWLSLYFSYKSCLRIINVNLSCMYCLNSTGCVSHSKVDEVNRLWLGFTFDFFSCMYKRSYVLLRNPIFCLSNQFLLNQCCAPSMVQFVNVQTFFGGKGVWLYQMQSNFQKIFSLILGFFMLFCFQPLNQSKNVYF